MAQTKTAYARGTYITREYPWGLNVACAAMCSDGKVRKCARIAQSADTFFSTPASVRVNGKHVSGFVTIETEQGFSVNVPADPAIVKFVAVRSRKNANLLPEGAWKSEAADQV